MEELKTRLEEKGIAVIALSGSLKGKDINDAFSKVHDNKDGEMVVVATSKYLGEGTDISYLDTLVMATPVSFEGLITQFAGRIAREYDGKRETNIVDYVDVCNPSFEKMYTKRQKTYRKLGYLVKEVSGHGKGAERTGTLFEKSFFLLSEITPALSASIDKAQNSIVISSPYICLSRRTRTLAEHLSAAMKRGIKVTILSKHSGTITEKEEEGFSHLQSRGLTVIPCPYPIRFSLIDNKEVWFGDVDILGGNPSLHNEDEGVMLHSYDEATAEALGSILSLYSLTKD